MLCWCEAAISGEYITHQQLMGNICRGDRGPNQLWRTTTDWCEGLNSLRVVVMLWWVLVDLVWWWVCRAWVTQPTCCSSITLFEHELTPGSGGVSSSTQVLWERSSTRDRNSFSLLSYGMCLCSTKNRSYEIYLHEMLRRIITVHRILLTITCKPLRCCVQLILWL